MTPGFAIAPSLLEAFSGGPMSFAFCTKHHHTREMRHDRTPALLDVAILL